MLGELEEVTHFKEIKSLENLQVKTQAYLEFKRVSMKELF